MINEAIVALGVSQGYVLYGEPANAAEFAENFRLITGTDESGTAILSDDLSGLGITWEQVLKKVAELQAAEPMRLLRTKRDRLLAESDWWASSDLTMSAKRKSYRQALRDLPANTSPSLDESGQLTGVTWPTKPA